MPTRLLVSLTILGVLIVFAGGGVAATQSLDDELTIYEELTGDMKIGNTDTSQLRRDAS